MGIFSSDEEPCWSDVYNLQEHNRKYEAKIARLRSCLQEIKAIAEQILNKNEFVYMNYRDVRQIIRLITKAESGG